MGTSCTRSVWVAPSQTLWIHPSFAFFIRSPRRRGNRASLWNWLELQFVGGRIDKPEFGVGLLRNRSAEKREVFVGVRPVLPIAHSADRISDLIAEAILQR